MDIKIDRSTIEESKYLEDYAQNQLEKYFSSYPFIESAQVYFRGAKHDIKKIKIKMRLKGKDIFAEAKGERYEIAHDLAMNKLLQQLQKYKSKRYRKAS